MSDGGGETDEEGMATGGGESLLSVPGTELDLKAGLAMTSDSGSLKGDSPRAEGGSLASAGLSKSLKTFAFHDGLPWSLDLSNEFYNYFQSLNVFPFRFSLYFLLISTFSSN